MGNEQEPDAIGTLGERLQLTYSQSRLEVSLLPGAYNPIQSLLVGLGICVHVTVNESPAGTDVGVAAKLTDEEATLNEVLVTVVSPLEVAVRV